MFCEKCGKKAKKNSTLCAECEKALWDKVISVYNVNLSKRNFGLLYTHQNLKFRIINILIFLANIITPAYLFFHVLTIPTVYITKIAPLPITVIIITVIWHYFLNLKISIAYNEYLEKIKNHPKKKS
jgi:hypothetical protein